MVRGNWQKRVETADARRKEAKQKKQRAEDKRIYKKWMQDLLMQIDHDYYLDNDDDDDDDDDDTSRKQNGQQQGQRQRLSSATATLHVWSDTMPLGGNTAYHQGLGLTTTTSCTNSPPSPSHSSGRHNKSKKKLHPRSKELDSSSNKTESSSATTDDKAAPLLCKKHFFTGKCSGSGSGCRHAHYSPSTMLTLSCALKKRSNDKTTTQLELCEQAVRTASDTASSKDDAVDAMEMVFYTPIDFQSSFWSSASSASMSDLITAAFTERSIPLSSIVYVVLNSTLLYDRYRNGSIIPPSAASGSERTGIHPIVGGDGGGEFTTNTKNAQNDGRHHHYHHLPGPILEHILTFLPDTAVTTLSQVCKPWHCEIGQKSSSPNLWIHLLQCQKWPVPKNDNSNNVIAPSTEAAEAASSKALASAFYRDRYIKHYLAMRNVRAMATGVTALLGNHHHHHAAAAVAGGGRGRSASMTLIPETEMTYQDFSRRRKSAPKIGHDACVALLEWSPHHMLAAYSHECSLRLFQAVRHQQRSNNPIMMSSSSPKAAGQRSTPCGGLSEKQCKEIICFNVDPYRSTKKRTCVLESVAIDKEQIGCLCSVSASIVPSNTKNAAILVFTSRDDFLLGESTTAATAAYSDVLEDPQVVDIGEAVLNYILSVKANNDDHRYIPLMNFLSNDGEIGDVSIKTSWHLVACGHGRFLVEVSIGVPLQDDNFDQGTIQQLDRQVVLFSAHAGSTVLWMGESYPMHTGSLPTAHDASMVLASCPMLSTSSTTAPTSSTQTGQLTSRLRSLRTIAARSEVGPSILLYELNSYHSRVRHEQGQQEQQTPPRFVEESCWVRNDVLAQLTADSSSHDAQMEWRIHPSHHLLVTETDIVAVDLLQCHFLQDNQQPANAQGDNDDDDDANRRRRMRDRKTIVSFYPHASQSSQRSSYDFLILPGMLRGEDMTHDVRNDHIIVLCTELQKKTRRSHGPFHGDRQGQQDNDAHDEEEETGVDGEWFGANEDIGNDPESSEQWWEESLVLVVIDVPSRCEIGRQRLPETKIAITMDQVHEYDARSHPTSWKPRLSSVSAGGTLGLALNVAGIVLTGDDVRWLGATDRVILTGMGEAGSADHDRHSQNSGKKKKKKGKKSSGGKKDGFARGMSLRG